MSAIWGVLGQGDKAEYRETFLEVYKNKTKIEKYDAYESDNIFMGCGMQYFTEPSHREILPLAIDNRIVVTADAILDNREEMADFIGTGDFCPDGELIARAYLKEGIQSVKRFRGIFSFAIYDFDLKKLYLATDQMSTRCLYYYAGSSELIFSTLISPILNICPDITIDELYIKDFLLAPGLAPNIVPGDTPYNGVKQLRPGTYIEYDGKNITEVRYYDISKTADKYKCFSPSEYGQKFLELYEQCVEDAIDIEGNVGIAMSSGFDSGSVGALAARQLNSLGKKLYSYTYVPFMDAPQNGQDYYVYDEKEDVLEYARMYDNIVPKFLNTNGKNSIDPIVEEIDIMEIPFKAYVNLPSLCEIYENARKDGCREVLSGQSGNMTVSYGYIDNILFDIYEQKKYIKFLIWLKKYCKLSGEKFSTSLKQCIRYYKYMEDEYKKTPEYTKDNQFVTDDIYNGYPLNERFEKGGQNRIVNGPMTSQRFKEFIFREPFLVYIGALETKMSLRYGVLLRDPTKDIRMMEFCFHLPYELFAYQGKTRWLIRENMKNLMPDKVINNLMRYSVQNYDAFERIVRDWDKVSKDIENVIKDYKYDYIDVDSIKNHISTNVKDAADMEKEYIYIVFVYIIIELNRWYEKVQS